MSTLKDRISTRTDAIATAHLPASLAMHPAEVVIGRIVEIGPDGAPIVDFPGNPVGRPVPARATACYRLAPLGSSVALMFLYGDFAQPLAIGLIAQPNQLGAAVEHEAAPQASEQQDCLTLAAKGKIVLQCGRASLTLTRAGKVLLRGAYVSSRSSGVQRITGASVHIN